MRPNPTYSLTFLAGVLVAVAARWLPYPSPTHAQAPSAGPGLFGAQSLSFTDFGDRPVQIFRLDEADGPYTVPEGKALIVTQLAGTLGQPSTSGYAVKLSLDGQEVWRVTKDNLGMGWFSNGIMIPGLKVDARTVVSLETVGSTTELHGVILGYLVG